ncbi:MAG: type II secretion system protein [Planctomycetota bacterium]|jgi:prepilin-type N-terminal cleavage/methylation domain-containing protein/prepilin-type processing-associated H-X9-DG protein
MRRKGFTLIELLVVISVISLLMAVLMPVLAITRRRGKTLLCLSNLRQLAIAAHVYADNNDGYYPIAYMYKADHPVTTSYAWDFITIKDWSKSEERVIPGLLWQGRTIEEVQQCPSFKGAHNWFKDPYTGYNYNTSYIGHGQGESIVTPAKAVAVKRPSQCALFGDGQWAGGANKFMRAPWPSEGDAAFFGRAAGTQGYRHCGRTNVVYCDGGATSIRELYRQTDSAEVNNIASGTGFLSPDNSAYNPE